LLLTGVAEDTRNGEQACAKEHNEYCFPHFDSSFISLSRHD